MTHTKQQPISAVKIGNNLSPKVADVTLPGCRPAAQHTAVMRWHKDHPSAHWCCNPFEPEPDGRVVKCSYAHTYFGADGRMHSIWVTPTGRIKDHYVGNYDFSDGAGGTNATLEKYGAFMGESDG